MLVQFAVENFMSFRDKAVFSLRALEGAPASPAYVDSHGLRLLRCAAIYGANASGKSNLVRALTFCHQLVLTGTKSNEKIAVKPFRLDPESTRGPSQFEFELLLSGAIYSYGFRIDAETVQEEWLFRTATGRDEELVFERRFESANPERAAFEFGSALSTDASRLQFVGFVGEGTRRNQLFLHEAVERNVVELEPVLKWFRGSLKLIEPDSPYDSLVQRVHEEPGFRVFLGSYLASADTGIAGLTTMKSEVPPQPGMGIETLEILALGLIGLQGRVTSAERTVTREEGKLMALNLRTQHRDSHGQEVQFAVDEESDGTRRLMHLAPSLHPVEQAARTSVIDELDRSLHPLLTRKFVRDFLSANPQSQEQLIFTTHDTNLLSRDLLPAEAVWFVEKDPTGCSHLYSLAEFDPAQLEQLGDSLEAGYLSGRFGAIPFFADRKKLGWTPGES
ncbi:AAA family ATPase [Archangium sp.]|uniref:AAA family ATPase n=1 Tax=Archangium sp. TaxID=1872627 RepID=UPI00389AB6FB